MNRRAAALVAAAAAIVAAVLAIVLIGGDDDNARQPSGPARAMALATAPSGDSYALIERTDEGMRGAAVGRVKNDGSIDAQPIDLPIDDVTALAIERDDALLVAGTRRVDGKRRLAIGRLDLDGRPDRSFGTDGVLTVKAGDGDAIPRGIAASTGGSSAAVVADATRDTRHAMALVRVDLGTGRTRVDLADEATAAGVVPGPKAGFTVAGTDTRNGYLVTGFMNATGAPGTSRSRTSLRNATWRAIAPIPGGGAVVVGSGRTPDLRSLIAFARLTPTGGEADQGTVAVGEGDAYGQAVQANRDGQIQIAANGTQDDAPAAYLVTFPGGRDPARKAMGRAVGVTPEGGMLVTRWDGQRQSVAFNP